MAEAFREKLVRAVENLAELRVITAIGGIRTVAAGNTTRLEPDIDVSRNAEVILTKINLLQGDITTVFPASVSTPSPATDALRTFHAEREKQAMQLVQGNIAAVKELLQLVASGLLDQQTGEPAGDNAP